MLINEFIVKYTQNLQSPVILEATAEIESVELEINEGCRCILSSCSEIFENGTTDAHIALNFDLENFEAFNTKFYKPEFFDTFGIVRKKYNETINYTPKISAYFMLTDKLPFRIVTDTMFIEEWIATNTTATYLIWLEQQLKLARTKHKI